MPSWLRLPGATATAAAVALLLLCLPSVGAADDSLPPGDSPPPTAFSRLEDAGTADDHEADYIIVYDSSVNRVKPTGVTYVDAYTLYKILTPAGCVDRSVLVWGYEPWSSHVEVRAVNILRDEERIPVDVANVHDLPAPQAGIYWNARVQTLQLPRLRVGDGIEVELFRKGYSYALLAEGDGDTPAAVVGEAASAPDAASGEDLADEAGAGDEKYIPPMPGEYFDIVLFEASVPIVEKRYTLVLPPDKRLHSQIYNGPLYSSTTYNEESTTYEWWAEDMPGWPHESRMPDPSDHASKVVVATVESWEAKSRWFFDVNESQFEVTPEVRSKVEEIFRDAGLTRATEEEKAAALVHWVAQNIRYSGQTMGEGEGFTLHSGAMIFEQRSGVCKDIAGMLITMMRAAGMDSYGAMTMAGSRIETVPADQFNHCVCALRKTDGSYEMYDPTWVPYYRDIWSKSETEQQYLIGCAEGESLASIPFSPAEESPLNVKHTAGIASDGTLTGSFRLDGSGVMDSRLRSVVGWSRIEDVPRDVELLLSRIGQRVELTDLRHRARDDFSGDMWIEIDYTVPRYAALIDDGLEFRSPMILFTMGSGTLFRAGSSTWPEERDSELFLWSTQSVHAEETIELPRGFDVVELPEAEEVDETYGYFDGACSQDGRDLEVTLTAEVRRRQIPPEGYEGFRAAMVAAGEWRDTVYRAEKGGDK